MKVVHVSCFSPIYSAWLSGLGVWFSLRVREVPGSNPGWALQHSTRQVHLLLSSDLLWSCSACFVSSLFLLLYWSPSAHHPHSVSVIDTQFCWTNHSSGNINPLLSLVHPHPALVCKMYQSLPASLIWKLTETSSSQTVIFIFKKRRL